MYHRYHTDGRVDDNYVLVKNSCSVLRIKVDKEEFNSMKLDDPVILFAITGIKYVYISK